MNQELPDIQSGKGKDLEKTGNQRSNCPHMLNHRKNKGTTKQKTNTHAHTHTDTHTNPSTSASLTMLKY